MYADAISHAGAPFDSCVGFVDGERIGISCPGRNGTLQRSCYSGRKSFHFLMYQTLTTPYELIFAIYGPSEGRRHDVTLLRSSGWSSTLEQNLHIEGRQDYLYEDSAYSLRPWMQRPYVGCLTNQQNVLNEIMSSVRVSVEHSSRMLNNNAYSRLRT